MNINPNSWFMRVYMGNPSEYDLPSTFCGFLFEVAVQTLKILGLLYITIACVYGTLKFGLIYNMEGAFTELNMPAASNFYLGIPMLIGQFSAIAAVFVVVVIAPLLYAWLYICEVVMMRWSKNRNNKSTLAQFVSALYDRIKNKACVLMTYNQPNSN